MRAGRPRQLCQKAPHSTGSESPVLTTQCPPPNLCTPPWGRPAVLEGLVGPLCAAAARQQRGFAAAIVRALLAALFPARGFFLFEAPSRETRSCQSAEGRKKQSKWPYGTERCWRAVGDAAHTAHLCGLLGACHPADIACNCWEQVGDKLQTQPRSCTGWFRASH